MHSVHNLFIFDNARKSEAHAVQLNKLCGNSNRSRSNVVEMTQNNYLRLLYYFSCYSFTFQTMNKDLIYFLRELCQLQNSVNLPALLNSCELTLGIPRNFLGIVV